MKAFIFDNYGGPAACHFGDLPDPEPGPDDVLVRVHAASVNPWDVELSRGKPWINRLIAGGLTRPRKFAALGCDIAGIVERVGANVRDFAPGDRVMADNSASYWGGYAELALAKAAECAVIPDALSMTDAASLPQAGILALQALRDYGNYEAARTVLINGAGGGAGPIALQLARKAGAEVHAVDHGDKLAGLTALGATEVFDYREVDFITLPHRYDLIFDPVQQHPGRRYRRVLSSRGIYATIGGKYRHLAGVLASMPFQPLMGGKRLRLVMHRPNGRDLGILAGMATHGAFRPVIARIWPFAETAAALDANGRGHGLGKHVISMD